jgi:putative ABC transport system substrate-binding protein
MENRDYRFSLPDKQTEDKPMRKTIIRLALCTLFLAHSFFVQAQQPMKGPQIGFLIATSPSAIAARVEAFRQGLRELGYLEGKDIIIEYRYAEGKFDRLPDFAAELVRLKVAVIVTAGPQDTRAAAKATSTIPIVMAQETDPVGSGFVVSLARPGGNITGLSTLAPELSGKQLELLKEIVPKLSRAAVLGNSTEPGNAQSLKETQLAAGGLKVQLQHLEVRDLKEIDTAFSAIKRDRAGALIVLRNSVTSTHREYIVKLVGKSRLPAIYPNREWVEAGGLMFYGANIPDNWRRAASYVDRILKGRLPADLPVEQPMRFEFVVNLKAAKQIGLTIPQWTLQKADRVIR